MSTEAKLGLVNILTGIPGGYGVGRLARLAWEADGFATGLGTIALGLIVLTGARAAIRTEIRGGRS